MLYLSGDVHVAQQNLFRFNLSHRQVVLPRLSQQPNAVAASANSAYGSREIRSPANPADRSRGVRPASNSANWTGGIGPTANSANGAWRIGSPANSTDWPWRIRSYSSSHKSLLSERYTG